MDYNYDPYLPKNYYKTKYWNQSWDCCLWDGVTCNESTGFVIGPDLSCGGLTGNLNSNSTLFRLSHLLNLNLAFNNFIGSKISFKFGHLNSLTHLNLSNSGFSGQIPMEFYYLSDLVLLDISRYYYYDDALEIHYDVKLLFGNITKIRVVMLGGVNISSEMPTNMSSFLTHLDLSWTGIHGKLPATIFEKPNLQVLRLCGNYGLKGSLPKSLNRSIVHSIKELDLWETNISGRLPNSIGFMSNLNYMRLVGCKFWGSIPESIGNITEITEIDLAWNEFSGEVPSTIFNLRLLNFFSPSSNHLEGQLPDAFSNLQKLTYLDLSDNSLVCQIPSSLTNMSQLEDLDFSYNALTGPFPSRAGHGLQKLWYMDLSHNSIEEYLPSQHLENLDYLNLHNNSLQGTFPSSICNLSRLYLLDLSNNKFRGKIPECFGNSSSTLGVLDLSRNEFHGTIPATLGNNGALLSLGLSDNHLEGPFPQSLANCTCLGVVDLGNNGIQDNFPSWIETLTQLKIPVLKSNRFHGTIRPPVSNDSFSELRIIDLSHNNFTGLLPDILFARLQAMKKQDETATYPPYLIGDVSSYRYSVTLSVKGGDLEFPRLLSILTTIDLSSNKFQGPIPESLAYLSSLRLLNLSHNSINGSIPLALGRMTNLEQLDLSSNQLTGGIPQTLVNLTFLADLNLSYNRLVGPIPQGKQFSTFSGDSYVGNLGLYGAPLTKNYGNGKAPPSPTAFQNEEDDDEDDSGFMMGFTWKAVVMGYGCGIVIGFILGNVMISIGKLKWFVRFYYREVANCLKRRKKRGRVVQGRR